VREGERKSVREGVSERERGREEERKNVREGEIEREKESDNLRLSKQVVICCWWCCLKGAFDKVKNGFCGF